MPAKCCVVGCSNRLDRDGNRVRFFRFPRDRKSKELEEITNTRQVAWLNAIRRVNLKKSSLKYTNVCSEHFITGRPAHPKDKLNPDWIPNKNMGYKTRTMNTTRYQRLKNRELQVANACNSNDTNIPSTSVEAVSEISEIDKLRQELAERDLLVLKYKEDHVKMLNCYEGILKQKDGTIESLRKHLQKGKLSADSFKDDDTKVTYFTGLPNFIALSTLFDFVKEDLSDVLSKGINVFDAFIIVLMKLRLDLPFTYLSYRYGIALSTVSKVFHENLIALSIKIGSFIRWPDAIALERNTPDYFKEVLGCKFTAIIDCFEIFTNNPVTGPALARSDVFFSYKYHNSLKYLIAISPAGAITFVSKGYGGRCSEKTIVESCGFLENTKCGDIILSDRGILINQVIIEKGAKLLIPAFRSGQDQMDVEDLERTRKLAGVYIHVKRVIDVLRQKYLILSNRQSITAISKQNDDIMYFDCIVKLCFSLVNVCPSIMTTNQ